jgi:plastocyanin
VPTPEEVEAQARATFAPKWRIAARLQRLTPPKNVVYMGYRERTVNIVAFLPLKPRVRVGQFITFINRDQQLTHNVAVVPAGSEYAEKIYKANDSLPYLRSLRSIVSPFDVYGSDPPTTNIYDGRNHGNGYFARILTDGHAGAPGLPDRAQVVFSKPGRYKIVCQIHSVKPYEMEQTIVVTR